jgi:iron complex outermembrane receptor protein
MSDQRDSLRKVPCAKLVPLSRALQAGAFGLLAAGLAHAAEPIEAKQREPAEALPTVTVEAGSKTATGPVHGYAAKRSATGTKTDTPILEIPQSISVIGREEIEAKGMRDLLDTLNYTPGIFTRPWGHDPRGYEYLNFRGFDNTNNFTHNYLDGIAQWGYIDTDAMTEVYGLERIEVLRGPASATFGQGDIGGVVHRVSKRPSLTESVREVQAQYGSFRHQQLAFDIGGRINETSAFRLVGLERSGDDQARYPNGETVKTKRQYLAPSFLWRPSAATSLTLLGSFLQHDAGDDFGYEADADGQPTNVREGDPRFSRIVQKAWTAGYEFRHDFNDTWGFRQNFRYADRSVDKRHIRPARLQADGRTLRRGTVHAIGGLEQTSLDSFMEGKLKTGKVAHRLIAGVDWTRLNGDEQELTGKAPDLDLLRPVYLPVAPPTERGDRDGPYRLNSLGVYLQDQIKFDERWVLTLSGRHDTAEARSETSYSDPRERTDRAVTGRAGLTWLGPNGWAPYVSYGTSFQPSVGPFDGFTDEPTKGKQWEAGVKYQPSGRDFLFTAALFDLAKSNIVATNPRTDKDEQAGKIRSRGLELEAKGELAPGLSVTAAYSYTNIKGVTGNTWFVEEGKTPIMAPKQSASLWFNYRFREGALAGLNAGLGARYVGSRWDDAANTAAQGGFTVFDASLRYDVNQHWRLALNATNLFGKSYYTSNSFDNWNRGEKRTVTGTATYRW